MFLYITYTTYNIYLLLSRCTGCGPTGIGILYFKYSPKKNKKPVCCQTGLFIVHNYHCVSPPLIRTIFIVLIERNFQYITYIYTQAYYNNDLRTRTGTTANRSDNEMMCLITYGCMYTQTYLKNSY